MRMIKIIFVCSLFLFAAACSGGGAKELYETAQFEELQNNHKHAIELYKEIIRDYPESEYAGKSGKRIVELRGDGNG